MDGQSHKGTPDGHGKEVEKTQEGFNETASSPSLSSKSAQAASVIEGGGGDIDDWSAPPFATFVIGKETASFFWGRGKGKRERNREWG